MTGPRGLSAHWTTFRRTWTIWLQSPSRKLACQLLCSVLVLYTQDTDVSSAEEKQESKSRQPVVIPYIVEMSKYNKHVCRKFDIIVVFRSGQILYSRLTGSRICYLWINSPLWCTASPEVVARPALERQNREDKRVNKHQDACERGMAETSAIEEQAMENHHPITERKHWSVLRSKETMY